MKRKIRFMKVSFIVAMLLVAMFMQSRETMVNAESLHEVPDGYIGTYTAEDLNNIRKNLKGKYILMNNIDLSSYSQDKGWEPIKFVDKDENRILLFKGILDGNGYTIKNLKIYRPNTDNVGLFAGIDNGGEVKNLRIENVSIIGRNIVGALAGGSSGIVSNCYIKGDIKGKSYVGGLLGRGATIIQNCSTAGNVVGSGSYISSITGNNSAYALVNCNTTAKVVGSTGILTGGLTTQHEQGWWYNVYNDRAEIYGFSGEGGKITIPSTLPIDGGYEVTEIAATTFSGNQSITSVKIPYSVEKIGQGAFANCSSLKSISLPNGIRSIEDDTFLNCSSLKNISIPSNVESIGREAFKDSGITTLRIPNSVKNIGWQAFGSCKNLQSIILSENLKTIEGNTFNGCGSLKNITIPNNVSGIGLQAFTNCSSLDSITIENANTDIFDCAYTITNDENPYLENKKIIIKGKINSKARAYAEKYGRPFLLIP